MDKLSFEKKKIITEKNDEKTWKKGNLPLRWMSSLSLAAERMAATVQAAPPMSPRILSMLAGGFNEIPPVSKVTPLPDYFV